MDEKKKRDIMGRLGKKEQKAFGEKMPPQAVSKPKFIAEHTVASDETLSHIALKYYGSAIKEKWMVIYEANKDVIGDDPGIIVPGQVLKIPELPK
jgi:nucleoid-associated protein YgaU